MSIWADGHLVPLSGHIGRMVLIADLDGRSVPEWSAMEGHSVHVWSGSVNMDVRHCRSSQMDDLREPLVLCTVGQYVTQIGRAVLIVAEWAALEDCRSMNARTTFARMLGLDCDLDERHWVIRSLGLGVGRTGRYNY
ncbi:hypothetical protein LR48_Vigan10g207400 [Vigna angularis]|uniref:Uncharacterized protein n=1 Tax=Phaseolus angularis TaxID=3914 RepID=A0A0L9VMQ7_PHAAN|nr:hypothetical protein LR48_Vigan10g207400 [Vigna angularis]